MRNDSRPPIGRVLSTVGIAFESGELNKKLALLDSPVRSEKLQGLDYIGHLGAVGRFRAETKPDPETDTADYLMLCEIAAARICPLLCSGSNEIYKAAADALKSMGVEGKPNGKWNFIVPEISS